MESNKDKNNPRVGLRKGESHTPASAGDRSAYTGGAPVAMEEGKRRDDNDDYGTNTDIDRHIVTAAMLTASEGEGSQTATPTPGSPIPSKFFYRDGLGYDTESGSETASSRNKDTDKEKERERFLRKRPGECSPEKDEEGARKPIAKRGRGRPPTTGRYVGQAKARKSKLDQEDRTLQTEVEREILEATKRIPSVRSHSRASESSSDVTMLEEPKEVTSARLGAVITESLRAIISVAQKKNLKGTSVAALNKATLAIRETCAILLEHSASAETRALEADNKRLSKELEDLKKELGAIKRRMAEAQPQITPVNKELNVEELVQRAVREAVSVASARMDARLEGLEARLLPEPRLRPPLAADKKKEKENTSDPIASTSKGKEKTSELEPMVTTLLPPLNPGPAPKQKKKRIKKSAAAVEAAAGRRDAAPVTAVAGQHATEEWSQVVKGKKGQVQRKREEGKKVPKKRKKKKNGGLRTPKTAAVVLTLQPEAEKRGISYKDVLEKAKQRVDLVSLEIPAVRFKVAVTGARLLEIPGVANKDKADKLAEKLKEVMEEDVVRIHRPQKCAELRLQGLDDSATPAEVARAISMPGGCAVGDIKVGEIRRDRRGRGSVWVKCPVEAAKKVTAPNVKVCVGWTIVRVVLLTTRPMICYRCQEAGHTRAICKSEVDRSELCLRCGQSGHMSAGCQNAPHCALCEAHGRPADHIVGAKSCGKMAPKKKRDGPEKGKAPKAVATTSTATTVAEAAPMDAS
ncbi:uncharacterized protein LOC121738264 [Aricia agestis]|uniref:uncharacterized protein LOC121738264 n=1 Tax=Aricia agestis TaxID=91739 RepID=UPI001C205E54|nr:uncharacterized protein LOC121738264 [Aricia agestis]